MSEPDDVIPVPHDDDDDDVAWALQTAAVQWRRGAKPDAVLWLRRAVESAMEVGHVQRATELNERIAGVEDQLVNDIFSSPPPAVASGADVDDLLDATVSAGRASIDIEFDDENEHTEVVSSADLYHSGGALPPSEAPTAQQPHPTSAPPPAPAESAPPGPHYADSAVPPPPASASQPPPRRRVRPPPAPSSMPKDESVPPPPHLPRAAGAAPRGVPDAVFESPTVVPAPRSAQVFEAVPDSTPTIATTEADILGELPPISAAFDDGAASIPSPPSFEEQAAAESEPFDPRALALGDDFDDPSTEALPVPDGFPEAPALPPPEEGEACIRGVSLVNVAGLQDLPPEAQAALVASARLERLDVDEEVSAFAVALVVEGWASIMPAIADVACAFAQVGDVVFTDGTLDESISMRVVAGETDTYVAVWDSEALKQATSDCPWVADELRVVADRFQALAGATIGPLGERLDDTLRQMVTSRCEVRTALPGDEIVSAGRPVDGMYIVGAGVVELTAGADVVGELGPGEFLFATSVMAASNAPMGARAGKSGALLLFAERHAAHELLVSVPPLLEILAG